MNIMHLMKRIQITSCLLFFMHLSAMAEGVPKVELFGGYSLFHQINNNIIERQGKNANGWNGLASVSLNDWLAIQTDISAHYFPPETNSDRERTSTTSMNIYRALFGPKFTFRVTDKLSPFSHTSIGISHLKWEASGTSGAIPFSESFSFTGYTLALGVGLDVKVRNTIDLRMVEADYIYDHFSQERFYPPDLFSRGLRLFFGLVFKLGDK